MTVFWSSFGLVSGVLWLLFFSQAVRHPAGEVPLTTADWLGVFLVPAFAGSVIGTLGFIAWKVSA